MDLIKIGYNQDADEDENNKNVTKAMRRTQDYYRIKNFWLFNPKTEEIDVSSQCPKLEKIRLDFVFQDMNNNLDVSPLYNFSNLETLDLNFYDNHENFLLARILDACGTKLISLIFNVCADYRWVYS